MPTAPAIATTSTSRRLVMRLCASMCAPSHVRPICHWGIERSRQGAGPGAALVEQRHHCVAATRRIVAPLRRVTPRTARPNRSTRQRVLPPLAVQQLLHELDALELHEPCVLLQPPVQRHAHLPGTGEYFR